MRSSCIGRIPDHRPLRAVFVTMDQDAFSTTGRHKVAVQSCIDARQVRAKINLAAAGIVELKPVKRPRWLADRHRIIARSTARIRDSSDPDDRVWTVAQQVSTEQVIRDCKRCRRAVSRLLNLPVGRVPSRPGRWRPCSRRRGRRIASAEILNLICACRPDDQVIAADQRRDVRARQGRGWRCRLRKA